MAFAFHTAPPASGSPSLIDGGATLVGGLSAPIQGPAAPLAPPLPLSLPLSQPLPAPASLAVRAGGAAARPLPQANADGRIAGSAGGAPPQCMPLSLQSPEQVQLVLIHAASLSALSGAAIW
jgi:hypothetical protein